MTTDPGQPPGPAVDAEGRQVIDPTANVLSLVEAAIKRVDDIAELRAQHIRDTARLLTDHSEQVVNLRAECNRDIMELRAAHDAELRIADEKLRLAESARIDAIRAVDVGAVQRAAEVAGTVAEALRNQVAATQSAAQIALAAALDPIQKDIADLRRAQYEAQGQRAQVVEQRGISNGMIAAIVGIGGLLLAVVAVVITVLLATQ